MAHGAARTHKPIREGLVAMMGPVIDTLLVCTCTALAILVTGVWQQAEGMGGVTLTAKAFEVAFPGAGATCLPSWFCYSRSVPSSLLVLRQ